MNKSFQTLLLARCYDEKMYFLKNGAQRYNNH